mgnify:CR=1 FL=1
MLFLKVDLFQPQKLASSTARPKLWRPGARWRKQLQTSAWAQNVQENHPQPKMSESGDLKVLFEYGPTLKWAGFL